MRATTSALRRRFSSSAAASSSTDVVVCGAGIVGVSCAHYLAARGARVTLLDERPALSYTSALSTECYRNYWSGNPTMTAFMNRSIDLLEHHARESGNRFSMNRRGYAFLSATAEGAARHVEAAHEAGGAVHTDGSHDVRYDPDLPFDADASLHVFSGREAVRSFLGSMPSFVADDVCSLKFAGRCGWMNAQQMGSHLLETGRAAGVRTLAGTTLRGVTVDGGGGGGGGSGGGGSGRVSGVVYAGADGEEHALSCGAVVNCAGPFAGGVGERVLRGAPLPLRNEIHAKAVLRDGLRAVPPATMMMIWDDEIGLGWSEEEAEGLAEMGGFEARLASPLPAGAHLRPYPAGEGEAGSLLMLWEAPSRGPSGRLGGGRAGHQQLLGLRLKAWGCPLHSRRSALHLRPLGIAVASEPAGRGLASQATAGGDGLRLATGRPRRPFPPHSALLQALHMDVTVAEPPPETPTLRDHLLGELMLRGLSPMVPAFGRYLDGDGSALAGGAAWSVWPFVG